MKCFVCVSLTAGQRARLQSAAGIDLVYFADATSEARRQFDSCEVAFGNPPPDWLANSTGPNWIQLESVGFGEYAALDWSELAHRVKISNLKGFFAEPVAETILAGVLSQLRGIAVLARLQAERKWAGDDLRPALRTLHHADVVLFGRGDINRRVGELLAPYNCDMTWFGTGWRREELLAALRKADIVICTVPHTPATAGMFGRELLDALNPGCIFVNAGRGSLVEEDALADSLHSGRLAGAVIDVTHDEPLPAGHRFWTCPNLLLTQHTGGGTSDEVDRKVDLFLDNLARYRRGEAPNGLVDFQKGY